MPPSLRTAAPALFFALAVGLLPAAPAPAQVTVQNDGGGSLVDLEPVELLDGDLILSVFYPDESLYPFRLVGAEIYWVSEAGGADPVTAAALHVYEGGNELSFNLLDSVADPTLLDGEMNQFDLSPLDLAFASGPVGIALELNEDTGPGGPGVALDDDGCTNDRNFLFRPGDGWSEGCYLLFPGDCVIRLLVEPFADHVRARRGTCNLGIDTVPANVITVNGSAGDDLYREITAEPGTLMEIEIVKPPQGGGGLYAFWIFDGEPNDDTVAPALLRDGVGDPVDLGLAPFCLPTNNAVPGESCPCPLEIPIGFTSISIRGADKASNLCLHPLPRDPFPPASFFLALPEGTYTIGGLILDPGTATPGPVKRVSLTNSVVVIVAE